MVKLFTSLLAVVVVSSLSTAYIEANKSASRVIARKLSAQSSQLQQEESRSTVDDAEVKESAQVALDWFTTRNTSPTLSHPCNLNLRVKNLITSQMERIDRGVRNYTLKFSIEPSLTRGCFFDSNEDYTCDAEVIVTRWQNKREVKKISCEPFDFSKSPMVPGGWLKLRKNLNDFVGYAQVGLNKFGCDQKRTCSSNLLVDTIESVEKQSVNGVNYRITFYYKPLLLNDCVNREKDWPKCTVVINVPGLRSSRGEDIVVDQTQLKCDMPKFRLKRN